MSNYRKTVNLYNLVMLSLSFWHLRAAKLSVPVTLAQAAGQLLDNIWMALLVHYGLKSRIEDLSKCKVDGFHSIC
ncbi:hypothetical protein chiPu_0004619 [Chiloscyllium punctatum]|uniref:Uncharacterized protein n=1 Tax=Chiloscyllium punctatum TaxID=137246 RepID=A0A401S739_CHIPU|nr:hypothetical protein [Chiloscyllium punctatum]